MFPSYRNLSLFMRTAKLVFLKCSKTQLVCGIWKFSRGKASMDFIVIKVVEHLEFSRIFKIVFN